MTTTPTISRPRRTRLGASGRVPVIHPYLHLDEPLRIHVHPTGRVQIGANYDAIFIPDDVIDSDGNRRFDCHQYNRHLRHYEPAPGREAWIPAGAYDRLLQLAKGEQQ